MAWNRPTEKKIETKRAPGKWRGAAAGLLAVCAIAVGAWFFFAGGGRDGASAKARGDKAIKDAAPARVRQTPAKSPKQVQKPKTVEEALANIAEKPKTEIKRREISPEEWNRLTNRVFKTGTEQLLSWVCQVTPGDMPMPIPHLDDEEKKNLVAILFSKNPVKEGDSERIANLKQDVDYAKKEMAKYIREGGDPDEFLQYYFKELKNAFEYRNEVLSQISELYEDGDRELARAFAKKANEILAEKGIRTVAREEFDEEPENEEEKEPQKEVQQ